MRCRNVRLMLVWVVLGIAIPWWASLARATVYGWRDERGVWHLSNDLDLVPESARPGARQFTSKLAEKGVAASPEITPSPETTSVNLQISAYERGLEQGLQTAERQVALAGELARSLMAAAPQPAPTRIIIQQPGPTIIREVSSERYPLPFYGFIGPSAPFHWGLGHGHGYAYGFRRLVPHSHFFPSSRRSLRARRTGLFSSRTFRARHGEIFFPHGHFSHQGFLSGHGFVLR